MPSDAAEYVPLRLSEPEAVVSNRGAATPALPTIHQAGDEAATARVTWRGLRHHRQVLARARAVSGMLRNRAPRGSLPARMLLPASWLLSEPPIRSRGLLEACCSAHLNGTRCPAPPCTLALPACKAASRVLPTATVRRTSVGTISHDTAKAVAIARAALGGPEVASVRATARKSVSTQCRVGRLGTCAEVVFR